MQQPVRRQVVHRLNVPWHANACPMDLQVYRTYSLFHTASQGQGSSSTKLAKQKIIKERNRRIKLKKNIYTECGR